MRPTYQQYSMTATEVATRIAVICTETMKPEANREALLRELHQLEKVQADKARKLHQLEVSNGFY